MIIWHNVQRSNFLFWHRQDNHTEVMVQFASSTVKGIDKSFLFDSNQISLITALNKERVTVHYILIPYRNITKIGLYKSEISDHRIVKYFFFYSILMIRINMLNHSY